MPPPKRPFTTSSLTSSLKSTFANQPLLSNLTNLDKLTDHATNLAHKAPFFDALNEQFQQARARNIIQKEEQQGPASDATKPPASSGPEATRNMSTLATSKPLQNVSDTNVDMSHLSEQERLMIQSVMAKAEMSETMSHATSNVPNSTIINQVSHMNQPMSQPQKLQQMNQQQPGYNQNLSTNQNLGQLQPISMISGTSGFSRPHQAISNQTVNQNNPQSIFDQMDNNVMHQTTNQTGPHSVPFNSQCIHPQNFNLATNNQSALNNSNSLPQQNLLSQSQLQSSYGHLIQQQDSQAINQQQILGASQRAELLHQKSLLGLLSNQIPMQSQDNSATYIHPLNVIGQPNLNNQFDTSLQQHQQMLFRDRNNLAVIDASGNIITPTMQNLNMHNQQSFPNTHPQPESILRNREGREGIRFRSDTFRDEYAFSDHDTNDDHRRHKSSRRRDERSLRRHNSTESGSRIRRSSRLRSKDSMSSYEDPVPSAAIIRQRQLPKLAELGRQPVQHKSNIQTLVQSTRESRKLRSTPTMKRSARFRHGHQEDSPSISTESEPDEPSIESSLMSEERVRNQRNVDGKQISPRLQQCTKSVTCEMNDDSIKRLGELKLTEQASQVMEQQQLLIQQSQELIRLQQAQLEQQSKSKEKESTQSQMDQVNKQTDLTGQNTVTQSVAASNLESNSNSKGSKVDGISREPSIGTAEFRDASNQIQQMSDPSPRAQLSKATSVDSIDLINIENDASDQEFKAPRLANQSSIKAKPVRMGVTGSEGVSQRRYNLKSQSETTDSDGELIQHSSTNRRHRGLHSSLINQHGRTSAIHRREPIGLPPSPLPVSAAIQLHQLQQKHSRDESDSSYKWAKNQRKTYSRSKSVCNSPNHLLSDANFNRSIDEIRQPDSPDANSAFGLRRKRLPEPPSNSMPLTPSMVRKMIDAQKAAATSSNKLLTSVNAQSTLLTNMHTYRNPCFDRAPNEVLRQAMNSKSISKYLSPACYTRRSVGSCGTQVSFLDPKISNRTSSDRENFRDSDLRGIDDCRYTKSNYSNSILKGSKYHDIFSTPLVSREFGHTNQELEPHNVRDSVNAIEGRIHRFSDRCDCSVRDRTPNNLGSTNFQASALASGYVPKPSHQSDSMRDFYNSYRRNSEGESILHSGIHQPLYDRQNYTYQREASSSILPDKARDLTYRLSHSALPSPLKRYPRLRATNENHPEARYDLSSREICDSAHRHISHWPASYLGSVASPKRHFGISLEGMNSTRLDSSPGIACSPNRYANLQTNRYSDPNRDMLRDKTTRRNDCYAGRIIRNSTR